MGFNSNLTLIKNSPYAERPEGFLNLNLFPAQPFGTARNFSKENSEATASEFLKRLDIIPTA